MLGGRLVSVEDEEELLGEALAAAAAKAAFRRSMRAFFVEAGGGVPTGACGDAV